MFQNFLMKSSFFICGRTPKKSNIFDAFSKSAVTFHYKYRLTLEINYLKHSNLNL